MAADTENSQIIHLEADCPNDNRCRWKLLVAFIVTVVAAAAALGGFVAGFVGARGAS